MIIKIDNQLDKLLDKFATKRVAIYCRVSKGDKDYCSSIEYQKDTLTTKITEHPNWKLVGVYSNIKSGLNIKRRTGFKQLLDDYLLGKIDIILTKSISRFSRNTIDAIKIARLLAQKGVSIMFETENLTFDESDPMVYEIRALLYEEESMQKSRDIRWGLKKRQSKGKYIFNASHLLGYRKTVDGTLEIVEEQAKIVRRIFDEFLHGKNFYQIAKGLERDGILTGAGTLNGIPIKSNKSYKTKSMWVMRT